MSARPTTDVPGDGLTDRVRAALDGDPPAREVRMFGSLAFMVADRLLVAVGRDGSLLVRIDPSRRDELLARPGAGPATMGSGRPMGPGWLRVGPDGVDSADDLSFWIAAAGHEPTRP